MKTLTLPERLERAVRFLCDYAAPDLQKVCLYSIVSILRFDCGDGPWNDLSVPLSEKTDRPKLQVIVGGRNREVQS